MNAVVQEKLLRATFYFYNAIITFSKVDLPNVVANVITRNPCQGEAAMMDFFGNKPKRTWVKKTDYIDDFYSHQFYLDFQLNIQMNLRFKRVSSARKYDMFQPFLCSQTLH